MDALHAELVVAKDDALRAEKEAEEMRDSVEKFGVVTAARVAMVRVAGELENAVGDLKATVRKLEEDISALESQGPAGSGVWDSPLTPRNAHSIGTPGGSTGATSSPYKDDQGDRHAVFALIWRQHSPGQWQLKLGRRARASFKDQWQFLGDFGDGRFRSGDTLPKVAQRVTLECTGTDVNLKDLFTTSSQAGSPFGSTTDFSTVQQQAVVPLSPRPKPPGEADSSDFR